MPPPLPLPLLPLPLLLSLLPPPLPLPLLLLLLPSPPLPPQGRWPKGGMTTTRRGWWRSCRPAWLLRLRVWPRRQGSRLVRLVCQRRLALP